MAGLNLTITILLVIMRVAGCDQATSVCREQISTSKGRIFLVTFSAFLDNTDFKSMLYIGSQSSGSVNITKHIGSSSTTDVQNISPGINEISISSSKLVQTNEGKHTKILHIKSTTDIAVYMAGFSSPSDTAAGYTVFPERAWSTKYVVPSFKPLKGYSYKSAAIVSSFKQDTYLQMTNPNLNYALNATLRADESYALLRSSDISGTTVQSNTSVSLVGVNNCAQVPEGVGYCDTLLDSPIPVAYWEKGFIVPPLTPKLGYLVRVFAQDSNETVNILVKNRTHTINQVFTGMYEALFETDASVITTDKKVNVVQYGLGQLYDHKDSDPFMTSVPAVQHYGNDYFIPSPLVSDGFINTIAITIRQTHISGLLMDGQPVGLQSAKTITPVQPYDHFRIISLNLTSGNHNLSHTSSDAAFSVLLYGRKAYSGFGFYLGYTFHKDVKLCENGGICSDTTTCQCQGGYTGDRCQFDINECVNDTACHNGATCVNTVGSYTCLCSKGWTGKHCETDLNECLNASVCHNGATCANTVGSYTCLCSNGWSGNHCETAITTTIAPSGQVMCFACEDTSALSFCETIELCQANELCFLEKFASAERHIHYRSGCKHKQICSLHNKTVVGLNGDTCLQCCEGSFCNSRGCGDEGFPPKESRGPVCLDCAHVKDPKECDQTTLCSSDEVCYIEELKWGDESIYRLGCRSNHQCAFETESPLMGSRPLTSRSIPVCQDCCHDDFCNRNCTRPTHDNLQVIVG